MVLILVLVNNSIPVLNNKTQFIELRNHRFRLRLLNLILQYFFDSAYISNAWWSYRQPLLTDGWLKSLSSLFFCVNEADRCVLCPQTLHTCSASLTLVDMLDVKVWTQQNRERLPSNPYWLSLIQPANWYHGFV